MEVDRVFAYMAMQEKCFHPIMYQVMNLTGRSFFALLSSILFGITTEPRNVRRLTPIV